MDIPVYQVDAFATRPFTGNPAAVCPLDAWLDDGVMQAIAAENNVSATAFVVGRGDGEYDIRWFSPGAELGLCGHGSLAAAWVLYAERGETAEGLRFNARSGETVRVARRGERLVLDFPALPGAAAPVPDGLATALGAAPTAFVRAVKNMAVFETEAQVRAIEPDLAFIAAMDGMGLIVTAPGDASDCASRYFAPHIGIDEDPVTGSAHCTLVPYWAQRLGKPDIHARQVSARAGDLYCRDLGARVEIGGSAVTTLKGTMTLP